ncbi:MAG TPA: DUF1772 domain-containing protein [Pyrinomonadaceae bacterium]|nr:DUF1772 domain-containing protein [Pyrinomonadaceae bacterium]
MNKLRMVIICLAATLAAGLLFANVYNSVVDVPNWGHDIPASIETTRAYFSAANPGTFFRIFSPALQIVTFVGLALCWRVDRRVRYYLLAALVFAVATDAMTFAYFYPRNDIMFVNPVAGNVDAIRSAWSQWSTMNWPRSVVVAIGLVFDFAALTRFVGRTAVGSE